MKGIAWSNYKMLEILLKIFIIIIFLSMNEIPYMVKMIGLTLALCLIIFDYYAS